eukprot:g36322.t1
MFKLFQGSNSEFTTQPEDKYAFISVQIFSEPAVTLLGLNWPYKISKDFSKAGLSKHSLSTIPREITSHIQNILRILIVGLPKELVAPFNRDLWASQKSYPLSLSSSFLLFWGKNSLFSIPNSSPCTQKPVRILPLSLRKSTSVWGITRFNPTNKSQLGAEMRRRTDASPEHAAKNAHASTPATSTQTEGIWSPNPVKAEGEKFFLLYAFFWVSVMAYIVLSGIYETFDKMSYLYVGFIVGVPPVVIPLFLPGKHESVLPWHQRYTTKANVWIAILSFIGNYANVWIAILSFIGNYVWTHYFYVVLKTDYTFPSHRLNNVPIACYFLTHSYFLLYHGMSNIALRLLWRKCENLPRGMARAIVSAAVFVMATISAFMEAYTIQEFPYYSYPSRCNMFVYGSVFYGIYFWCSYPMYFRLDEVKATWTLGQVALDSFACCMMVTLILDFWRLLIGNVNPDTPPSTGMPFVY